MGSRKEGTDLLEKEELIKTDDVYLTITDMETFDYVEGRILITSGQEGGEGHLYCHLNVYYYGVLYVDSPSGEIFVPQPETTQAGHALYYRFYDSFTSTLKELFLDTFGISPKVDKKDFLINLNEPYCKVGLSYKAIVVEVAFKYQIFARTRSRNLIQAQTKGVDPSRTFVRSSSEIAKGWETVLRGRLPKEVSDPDTATKFFTETFSVLKKDAKITKPEHSIDVSFVLFDFIFEDPSVPAFQVGEYQFGFPVPKTIGNALREKKQNVTDVLQDIMVYLSLLRNEDELRSFVEITDSHIQQARTFPSPMLFGRPYAIYKEFLFSEEVSLIEEIPEAIMRFLERRKGR